MAALPRFAFLLLEEHPYGREMLMQLLAGGFIPEVVIQESSEVADEEREKFLVRIAGHRVAPTVAEQAREHGLTVLQVSRHSSETVCPLLPAQGLDLVVLGGTRVLRGPLLDLPRDGVINCHPGLLPECRGSASPAWSVIHDIPIGATAHFCDSGIDTGELLLRREFPVTRGMTYEDLCHGTLVLAGSLMREALEAYIAERWDTLRTPQGRSAHPTFRNAPQDVIDEVGRKLRDGEYAHYVG